MLHADWPRSAPTLIGAGLRLRGWLLTDAPSVMAACQDPVIQRWLPVPVPYLLEDATDFVSGFACREWKTGHGAPFAITEALSNRLVGAISLKDVDRALRTAELGYWVAREARGRGVASRSIHLLSDWAFEIGLERLDLFIEPDNLASRAVAERAGSLEAVGESQNRIVHGQPRGVDRFTLTAPSR